jgi:hypothetical protein
LYLSREADQSLGVKQRMCDGLVRGRGEVFDTRRVGLRVGVSQSRCELRGKGEWGFVLPNERLSEGLVRQDIWAIQGKHQGKQEKGQDPRTLMRGQAPW